MARKLSGPCSITQPSATGKASRSRYHQDSTLATFALSGQQIEYEDEDPQIHKDFEAAMKRVGAQCNMGAYHPGCTYK